MKDSTMIGRTFGSLTVIGRSVEQRRLSRWECRCICGASVVAQSSNLNKRKTPSCVCSKATHGLSKTPEHNIWLGMRNRCSNPRNASYAHYGQRGITVVPRWASFERFLEDMGPRPSPKHSIERQDNDGPYSPDNCYWATATTQANNKRNSHMLSFDGQEHSIAEWARLYGLTHDTLERRINLLKWPVGKAITTPPRGWGPGNPRSF